MTRSELLQERLQELSESDLQHQVIVPLLREGGFDSVRSVGGPHEKGKDLIATKTELGISYLYAIQIKKKAITGNTQRSAESLMGLFSQLKQALQEPIVDPTVTNSRYPHRLLFFTPFAVNMAAFEAALEAYREISRHQITVIDGPQLADQVATALPELAATLSREVNYANEVEKECGTLRESTAFGISRKLSVSQIYVETVVNCFRQTEEFLLSILEDHRATMSARTETAIKPSLSFGLRLAGESRPPTEAEWLVIGDLTHRWFPQRIAPGEESASRFLNALYDRVNELRSAATQDSETAGTKDLLRAFSSMQEFQAALSASTRVLGVLGLWRDLTAEELRDLQNFQRTLRTRAMGVAAEELGRAPCSILLTGGAGAGKTTLLQRIALLLRDSEINRPLFLRAIDLEEVSARDVLRQAWKQMARQGEKGTYSAFKRRFSEGGILLIIDGIDELGERARAAVTSLAKIDADHPQCRILASMRDTVVSVDWTSALRVGVHPFDSHQVGRFIRNWFQDAPGRAEDLIAWLGENPGMRAIVVTPVVAALLCALHEGNITELPTTETDLYESRLDLLLGRWEQAKGFAPMPPKVRDRYRLFLAKLAFEVHRGNARDVTMREAREVASPFFVVGFNRSIDHMISDCIHRGLLLEEGKRLSFGHLTNQEFLVGKYLHHFNPIPFMVEACADPWWHAPLTYYASLIQDVSALLQASSAQGRRPDWELARRLRRNAPLTPARQWW